MILIIWHGNRALFCLSSKNITRSQLTNLQNESDLRKKGLLKLYYFAAFDSYFVSRSNIGSPQLHRLSVSNPLE